MRASAICLAFPIVLLCTIASAQWTRIGLEGRSIKDLAAGNNALFAVTEDGSVSRSMDGGNSWESVWSFGGTVTVANSSRGTVLLCVYDGLHIALMRSTDNGLSWTPISVPGVGSVRGPGNIAAAPWGDMYFMVPERRISNVSSCMYTSTDDGLSWSTATPETGGAELAFSDSFVISYGWYHPPQLTKSAFQGEVLFFSSDMGSEWQEFSSPPFAPPPTTLAVNLENTFFWGNQHSIDSTVDYGLWKSADLGTTWGGVSTIEPEDLLTLPRGDILAATNGEGFLLFGERGDSLGTRNEGLTNLSVHTLAMDSIGYVYAGTDSGVWRRPLSEIVTSVRLSSNDAPYKFMLHQNYPNPFNPTTSIKFEVPSSTVVTLKVFDVLGREVATLVNEEKSAGAYTIQWDASGVSSGVYFYRLKAGDFVQTKRMMVVR